MLKSIKIKKVKKDEKDKALSESISNYFDMQLECERKYGKRTLLLYQIGSFLEMYQIILEDGTQIGNASIMKSFLKVMNNSSEFVGCVYNKKKIVDMQKYGFPYNPDSKDKYIISATLKGYYVPIAYQTESTPNIVREIKELYSPTITPESIVKCENDKWFCGAIVKITNSKNISVSVCLINPFSRVYHWKEDEILSGGIPIILGIHDLFILYPPTELFIWYIQDSCSDFDLSEESFRNIMGIPHTTALTLAEISSIPVIKDTPEIIKNLHWNPTDKVPTIILKTFKLFETLYPDVITDNYFRDDSEKVASTLLLENQSLLQLNILSSDRDGREISVPKRLRSVIAVTDNTKTLMGKRVHEKWITSPSKIEAIINQRINIGKYLVDNDSILCGWIESLKKMEDITKLFSAKILGGISYKIIWDTFETIKTFLFAIENYPIDYPIDIEPLQHFLDDVSKNIVRPNDLPNEGFMIGGSSYSSYTERPNIDFPFTKNGCEYIGLDAIWNEYEQFIDSYKIIETFVKNINSCLPIKCLASIVYNNNEYSILLTGGKKVKISENQKDMWEKLNILQTPVGAKSVLLTINNSTNIITNSTSVKLKDIIMTLNKTRFNIDKAIPIGWLKFSNILKHNYEETIQNTINIIGMIDAIQSSAVNVIRNGYTYPVIKSVKNCKTKSGEIIHEASYFKAKDLRHPLIEAINQKFKYVPNDIEITDEQRGHLIFGVNSSGKSSLMKSVGIAIILGQAGLSVPASYLEVGIYDSIFTRIIGNDNLYRGQSTFEIESTELSRFLRLSTKNSIAIGDELCSGTEHYGAQAIVSASIEYLIRHNISFVFATHFQGLRYIPNLQELKNLKWSHILVECHKELGLKYIRKLMDGPGPIGYAIQYMEHMGTIPEMIEIAKRNYNIITSEEYALESSRKFAKEKSFDMIYTSWNPHAQLQSVCQICETAPVEEIDHIIERHTASKYGGISGVGSVNHGANLVSLCKECHRLKTNGKIIIHGYTEFINKNGIKERKLNYSFKEPDNLFNEEKKDTEIEIEEDSNITVTHDDIAKKDDNIAKKIIKSCIGNGKTARQIQSALRQNNIIMNQIEIKTIINNL